MTDLFDVTIIGGGPAGLYAAFYSGLRSMKTKLIECQPELGGKLLLYPEKMIWDVGGHPPVLGAVLARQLVQQALTFDPVILLNTKAERIDKDGENHFVITTHDGQQHRSKSVIMAIGGGIIRPKRLEIEGAEQFEGTSLHYTMPSLQTFRNKTVLISGGGNTAVDWAVELLDIARQVIVVCRKDVLSAHEAQADRLQNSGAVLLLNSEIEQLTAGRNPASVSQAVVKNRLTGERRLLDVDHVIVNHGYLRDDALQFAGGLELAKKDDFYYEGTPTGRTSCPGIFAAGDILTYEGKVNLILGAFQDAVNAVNSAKAYIDPAAEKWEMVSSHHEKFKERNRALIRQMMQ